MTCGDFQKITGVIRGTMSQISIDDAFARVKIETDKQITAINLAYDRRELEPALSNAQTMYSSIEEALRPLQQELLPLQQFGQLPRDISRGISSLVHLQSRIQELVNRHVALEARIAEELALHTFPDPLFENQYACCARILLPTIDGRYHVAALATRKGLFVEASMLTDTPVTHEHAERYYLYPALLATKGVLLHAERYPVRETALPVLCKFYERAMRRQNGLL